MHLFYFTQYHFNFLWAVSAFRPLTGKPKKQFLCVHRDSAVKTIQRAIAATLPFSALTISAGDIFSMTPLCPALIRISSC